LKVFLCKLSSSISFYYRQSLEHLCYQPRPHHRGRALLRMLVPPDWGILWDWSTAPLPLSRHPGPRSRPLAPLRSRFQRPKLTATSGWCDKQSLDRSLWLIGFLWEGQYLAYDGIYSPYEWFHVEFQWLVCTGCVVDDFLAMLERKAKNLGLRWIPLPVYLMNRSKAPFCLFSPSCSLSHVCPPLPFCRRQTGS